MKVGGTTISIVSDGTYLIDGGSLFGQVPRSFWEQQIKPDRKNRVKVGLNCLLIQTPTKNILVDSGMGSKLLAKHRDTHGLNGNKLLKGLKKEGLTARDIDILILTHLHFDHCGGCTKLDRSGTPVPTFTKAKVMVQRSCWEEANDPLERSRSLFDKEDFAPLEESGALSLLDGDSEIVPGVKTKVTNGHSQGHQIVLVEAGSERIAYLGDLIPTPYHVPLESISAYDHSPIVTLEAKREIVKMAIDGGWLLVFGHALDPRAGYIEQRNGRSQLFPVEV